jgi:hypothetical protein
VLWPNGAQALIGNENLPGEGIDKRSDDDMNNPEMGSSATNETL